MSEGILVAIIGLVGLLGGNVLTGVFDLCKTRMELNASKIQPTDVSSEREATSRTQRKRIIVAALTVVLVFCVIAGAVTFRQYLKVKSSLPVYAILYDDGSLVFQHGDQPDILKLWTGRKETYQVDMENGYSWEDDKPTTPWYSQRDFIQTVVFTDVIQPKSTAYWFHGCRNIKSIEGISRLDTRYVTNMYAMFYNCNSLETLDVSGFDTANVTNMGYMFAAADAENSFTTLDVSGFNTANVTNMSSMFQACVNLKDLTLRNFDTAKVTNMSYMFSKCNSLETLNVSGFDTANVTDMRYMFSSCKSLKTLLINGFDTAHVTNMSHMFYNCNSLETLEVSGFDTSNVTDMSFMFATYQAENRFTKLDVSGFKTAKVTNMSAMFQCCVNLKTLDVSGFNTENVTNMQWMFSTCPNLATIFASNEFVTSQVEQSGAMFYNCRNLRGDKGTVYSADYQDKTYARLDGGASAPGYFSAKS